MEYDQKLLRKVQLIQAEILKEFACFCDENNLKYQLYSGTLLGAVRHKGFIPWDDDIDVAMTRKDYERLLSIWTNNKDSGYFLQSYLTDKEYHRQFARLRKNDTIYKQAAYQHLNIHHGVFIDIFPLDDYNPNSMYGKFRIKILKILSVLNRGRNQLISEEPDFQNKNILKKSMWKFIKLTNIFIPKRVFDDFKHRMLSKQDDKAIYIADFTYDVPNDSYKKFKFLKSDFYDTIPGEFEGYEYPIPRDYDKYLTISYGNYLDLPPVEDRFPHHGVIDIKL